MYFKYTENTNETEKKKRILHFVRTVSNKSSCIRAHENPIPRKLN